MLIIPVVEAQTAKAVNDYVIPGIQEFVGRLNVRAFGLVTEFGHADEVFGEAQEKLALMSDPPLLIPKFEINVDEQFPDDALPDSAEQWRGMVPHVRHWIEKLQCPMWGFDLERFWGKYLYSMDPSAVARTFVRCFGGFPQELPVLCYPGLMSSDSTNSLRQEAFVWAMRQSFYNLLVCGGELQQRLELNRSVWDASRQWCQERTIGRIPKIYCSESPSGWNKDQPKYWLVDEVPHILHRLHEQGVPSAIPYPGARRFLTAASRFEEVARAHGYTWMLKSPK